MFKKNKRFMIIGGIAILVILPMVLNLLYPPHKLLISVWSPGELLSYVSSILVGAATTYLAYRANEMNKRMLENETRKQKVFVNFSEGDCNLQRVSGVFKGYILNIDFKNITDIPIVGAVAHRSNRIGVNGDWGEKNKTKSEVISVDEIETMENNGNRVKIRNFIRIQELNDHIFSMELELTSIYGLKTKQVINIKIINGKIYETCIIGE